RELKKTLEDLKTTQEELVLSEKMAALGQLIAGVAHEINTPLGAIQSSIKNIASFMDLDFKNLAELLSGLDENEKELFFDISFIPIKKQMFASVTSKEKRTIRKKLEVK